MAGESNADIYASFGVHNAVTANEDEYQQSMLELDVAVRDGDDSIELAQDDVEEGEDLEEQQGETQEDEDTEEYQEEQGIVQEGEQPAVDIETASTDIVDTIKLLESHEQAFQDMVEQAIEKGVSEDSILKMEQEYKESQELSKESYEVLKQAGYSKAMVDAFIQGQDSIVNQYTNAVTGLAGGREQFSTLYNYLEASEPELAESLLSAMEAKDINVIKAVIRVSQESMQKTYGKPAARSVAQRAIPAAPTVAKPKGYNTQAEMVQAMSDPRYIHDAKYRAEVEQKVIYTDF